MLRVCNPLFLNNKLNGIQDGRRKCEGVECCVVGSKGARGGYEKSAGTPPVGCYPPLIHAGQILKSRVTVVVAVGTERTKGVRL